MTSAVRPWLLICCAALAYGFAHFSWYVTTPLGRVPVLDERENLTLANQIAADTLPATPFYRAMGYPLVLAGLREAGISASELPVAALLLGVALHAACAVLIGAIAARWFDDPRAGLAAGLLAAFYPVFVHFATQRLDATLGMAWFLAGLLCLGLERERPRWPALAGAGLCWALASLTRPQTFTVWLLLPLIAIGWRRGRAGWGLAAAAVAAGGLFFAAQGWWQYDVSGGFRVLPWQGAYNLWAANRPGTQGRYYEQIINTAYAGPTENPALLESRLLYRRATGRDPDDIAAMNAYWRRRFFSRVLHHPWSWLAQLAGKTYALFNDWEQYNNKTYAYQKSLSPWLRWNPLGWGVLLVLGVAGCWRQDQRTPRAARTAVLIGGVYAAGVVLFYVSARFRLPLAALLCVWAGGALARPGFWRGIPRRRQWTLAATILAAGVAAFSWFDGVRDDRPVVQDHLLIARAAQQVGDDAETWRQAREVLALDPGRPEAEEFMVTSGFNRALAGSLADADLAVCRESARRLLADGAGGPGSRVIAAALAHDVPALRAAANRTDATGFNALGALQLLRAAGPDETARLRAAPWTAGTALFLMARQALDPTEFAAWARKARHPARWTNALRAAARHLFPRSAAAPAP